MVTSYRDCTLENIYLLFPFISVGFLNNGVDLLMTWCTYSERTSAAKEDGETTHKIEFGFAASSSN